MCKVDCAPDFFTLTLLCVCRVNIFIAQLWMDLSVAALWNMKSTGSQHVYSFMCYADVVAGERHVKGMLVSASGGNYYCNNWHGKSLLYILYGVCVGLRSV